MAGARAVRGALNALAVFALAAGRGPVHAQAADSALPLDGVTWIDQPLLGPMRTDLLGPGPIDAAEQRGEVTLRPNEALAFWLDPLAIARVRSIDGRPLRFGRIVGTTRAHAREDIEWAPTAPDVWQLWQTPDGGRLWFVEAPRGARVHVERPRLHEPRLIWASAQSRVRRWIDQGGDPPVLPIVPGSSAFEVHRRAEAQLAELLIAREPSTAMREAMRAYRSAAAAIALAELRPLRASDHEIDDVALCTGSEPFVLPGDGPYGVEREDTRCRATLRSPGTLVIDVRGLIEPDRPAGALAFELAIDGAVVRRLDWPLRRSLRRLGGSEAVPVRGAVPGPDGRVVGTRHRISIALAPGEHRYELRADGAPLLIRARVGRLRPWAHELLDGRAELGSLVSALEDATERVDARHRTLLRCLRPGLTGPAPRSPQRSSGDLALLEAAYCGAEIPTGDRSIAQLPPELGWTVRIALADRATELGDPVVARQWIAGGPGPPAALWPELAKVIAGISSDEGSSERLAAWELAWRHAPLDPEVRREFVSAARSQTRSRLLSPHDAVNGRALRWLAPSRGPTSLPALGSEPLSIVAPRSSFDPARPALLRVYTTRGVRPGSMRVSIDGAWFDGLAVAPVEAWQFAVAPGPHTVRFEGPIGAAAYAGFPPTEATPERPAAIVRRMFPVRSDVRYALPNDRPTWVAIEVRASEPDHRELEARLRIHFDVGAPHTAWLRTRGIDATMAPLPPAASVGPSVALLVRVPPGAEELSLESDIPLVASVSVRADRTPPENSVAPVLAGARTEPEALAQLEALTRRLDADPRDVGARLARAHLLLDFGFGHLAAPDVARSIEERANLAAVHELASRMDAFTEADHLPAAVSVPTDRPTVLEPAVLATAPDEQWRIDRQLRWVGGADPSADDRERSPRERVLAAELTGRAGDPAGASLELIAAYRETGHLAVGLSALGWAMAALERDAAPSGLASLAFGLSRDLETRWGPLAQVRSADVALARTSRWRAIGTEQSAGRERWQVDASASDHPIADAVRSAMIAAPWPSAESQALMPARRVIAELALTAVSGARTELFCRVHDRMRGGDTCPATVLVDGTEVRRIEVPGGQRESVDLGALGIGAHRIEVVHAEGAGRWLSVRIATDRPLPQTAPSRRDATTGYALAQTRPANFFLATDRRPVVQIASGPTTLAIEMRPLLDTVARAVSVRVTAPDGTREERTFELPREEDPAVRGGVPIGRPIEALLLLDRAGAYRIETTSDSGTVAVRTLRREDRSGAALARPTVWRRPLPPRSAIAWPTAPPAVHLDAGSLPSPPQPYGTFSAALSLERTDVTDLDAVRPLTYGELALDWRRNLLPNALWLRVGARGRLHETASTLFGAHLEAYVRFPLGIRLRGRADYDGQPVDDAIAWSLRGSAHLSGAWVFRDFLFSPAVQVRARAMSAGPAEAERWNTRIDPDVYNGFAHAHRFALVPAFSAFWNLARDHQTQLTASATTNEDVASFDRLQLGVSYHALFDLGPLRTIYGSLGYGPTLLFADADRTSLLVRHDLRAELRATLWTGREGRVLLIGSTTLFASERDLRNTFALALRYDLGLGRGLADMLPHEERFEEIVGRRFWRVREDAR